VRAHAAGEAHERGKEETREARLCVVKKSAANAQLEACEVQQKGKALRRRSLGKAEAAGLGPITALEDLVPLRAEAVARQEQQ